MISSVRGSSTAARGFARAHAEEGESVAVTWRARILCLGIVAVLGRGFGLVPASADPATTCRSWKIVQSPTISGAILVGVSGTSPSDVWAVGYLTDQSAALIEHWDGRTWTLTNQIPRIVLNDVVAISSTDAWAVQGSGVAEHWDGTSWTKVIVPSPGTSSTLFKVSATSSSDVWAGGYYSDANGLHPLTIHYDGTSWTWVPAPDGSQTGTNVFRAITAVAPGDAWGVGYQSLGGLNFQPLTEHWDGTAWTVVPADPPPSGTDNQFWSVSGSASNDVWAVGIYDAALATPLVEHWDGTSWTFVTLSGLTNSNEAFGVATDGPADVWIVGKSFIDVVDKPFTEHWDGTAWKNERSPNPGRPSSRASTS